MKSGTHSVNTNWQKVELDGEDITDGTFSVFSLNSRRVGFVLSDVTPTQENGDFSFEEANKDFKLDLEVGDFLYAKTNTGTSDISVIKA